MKFSKRTLLKLKNKNKKLKPNKYKKLKREALRGRIKGTLKRPRLSVYRSNENIYAQIIDDTNSKTLISCSTLDRSIKLAFQLDELVMLLDYGRKISRIKFKKKYYKNCF
jgi:hypothetical protein